ncbi:MAG: phenylalanine--tRNA ligase subunit beta [Candidatus Magasanikbacteria bacterium]|nr:phenylalanine--tRNA ligase subunit beta [Candidatus Magasanikbacteria bacterium]
MNLLTSYRWLREYVDLGKTTAEEFAERVSLSGPGVEQLIPQGKDLENIVIGKILRIEEHPKAQKLRLPIVDIGGRELTIVCGGTNIVEGQLVAVALVGASVRWHGEGELIVLEPIEIRGVKSEGMICAANEIGLFDAFPHGDGEILDLGKSIPELSVGLGTPLADALGLSDDTIMDIEVTTNRPDAMGMVGMAREASAILDADFTWKSPKLPTKINVCEKLEVNVEEKELAPRYMAVRMDGVKVTDSPWWIKRLLLGAGVRPHNNVVDITNLIRLELGQPMHAFDAGKIAGDTLHIRKAKAGEKIAALDGITYELSESNLVIADDEQPQCIAGIMGGEHSAITTDTVSVIFEAATFDPVFTRRSARKLNVYSDSQKLFEKGLSTQAPEYALARAIEMCKELCGGDVSSEIVDKMAHAYKPQEFSVKTEQVTTLIGLPIEEKEMLASLKKLGFKATIKKGELTAEVPWWRDHDIESGRDFIEEIARLRGYAHLPAVFPAGISNRRLTKQQIIEKKTRTILKGAGLSEAFTYSFVSGDMMKKAGFDTTSMLRIDNPLTTDFEFMRTTLLPSMLETISENHERRKELAFFEMAHIYLNTSETGTWNDLPQETMQLSLGILSDDTAWKKAKGATEYLLKELGIKNVTWKKHESDPFWHPGRSAQGFVGEHLVATIGEIHPELRERYKFEGRVALADISVKELAELASHADYQPINAYPEAKRDLAFILDAAIEVQSILDAIKQLNPLIRQAEWFDTYKGKGIAPGKKSVAIRVTIGSTERTLESSETEKVIEEMKEHVIKEYRAESRS